MGLWVRVVRGLTLAGLVLGGVIVGGATASVTTATYAVAQGASQIAVEGNRRVESDTIRSYFRLAPGERLDALKVDEGVKALFATGLFQDVRPVFNGNRLLITVVENSVLSHTQLASPRAGARLPPRRCIPTCSASSSSIAVPAVTTYASIPRSSTGRTIAS